MANSEVTPQDTHTAPAHPYAPFGEKPLRTFALVVALPAFLNYVLSAVLVIGALALMSRDIDQVENDHGVSAMHAALNSFLNDLSNAVSDEGTWNEAYLNVVVNSDPAWMDSTWGATARLGQSYDNVLVTDANGEIVFGENNLGPLKGNISAYFHAAPAMLTALDKGIVSTGDAMAVSDFAADPQGTAGLAGISIHQSTPGSMSVPRQTRRVLWIARHVTDAVLQDISTHYQLPVASLVDTPDEASSSIQLADAAGSVAGTIAWLPERPGQVAFDRAMVIAGAIFFVLGIGLAIFLAIIRREMLRRAAKAAEIPAVAAAPAAEPAPAKPHWRPAEARDEPLPEFQGVRASDFTVQYQPVFDVRAEALVGVEALLRWDIPGHGLMLQETLQSAERATLFDRAGLMAIRFASDELAPLIGTMMAIAVTTRQLGNPEFAEKIIGTLGATGFPPRRLQLLLDSTSLPPLDTLRPASAMLREAGVQLILDRFVLGPQTVDAADRSFADGVRLAPSLVEGLDASPARQRLAASTLETVRAGGLSITVPGADHKADVARLVRLGCTLFQGELFAGPMPVTALTQLLLAPPVKRAS